MRPYCADNIFTPDECAIVIRICEQYGLKEATTYGVNSGERVAPGFRVAEDVRPPRDENTAWIIDRCRAFIMEANEAFQFELHESRGLEWCFVKYPVGGHFAQHTDTYGAPRRKITGSIQLSDSLKYDGGELHIPCAALPSKDIGSGIAFPSCMPHSVSKVTRGERFALVFWAHGERPFR